jgi:hypothetical protein
LILADGRSVTEEVKPGSKATGYEKKPKPTMPLRQRVRRLRGEVSPHCSTVSEMRLLADENFPRPLVQSATPSRSAPASISKAEEVWAGHIILITPDGIQMLPSPRPGRT